MKQSLLPFSIQMTATWRLYTTRFPVVLASSLLMMPLSIIMLKLLPSTAPLAPDLIRGLEEQKLSEMLDQWMATGIEPAAILDLALLPTWLAIVVLTSVVATFTTLMIMRAVIAAARAEQLTVTAAMKQAGGLLPIAVVTIILTNLLVLLGFVALVIPAIILSIGWMFILESVALSGRGGVAALRDSWQVMRGNWWPVIWRMVVSTILIISVATFLLWALSMTLEAYAGTIWYNVAWVSQDLLAAIISGFLVIYGMILFLELKGGAAAPTTEK